MDELSIAGEVIERGTSKTLAIQLARLYDYTELNMPIRVIRGKEDGPTLFVSAAIHGDEIIGTEIIKRLLCHKRLRKLRGTLIAIPIVNVFGYNNKSRYLPDRRDLNRSFPGSANGSLGARIADKFIEEIVRKSDYGVDLHSGSNHRSNIPQIRAWIENDKIEKLARSFQVPVILNSRLRDGSLREAALDLGVKIFVFEGGEGLRIDEKVVRIGLSGIFSLMESIGMLDNKLKIQKDKPVYIANKSYWLRAPQSGLLRSFKHLGDAVEEGAKIGEISDSFGDNRMAIRCKTSGMIIGENKLPLVNQGDAIYHIATFDDSHNIEELSEEVAEYLDDVTV